MLPAAGGQCYASAVLIPHPKTLIEARFLARYDRFIARMELDGAEVDAHCVNPGRMEGLVHPGARALLSQAEPGSKRKLRYTLEMLEIDGLWIGANTVIPNFLAETLVRARLVPGLKRYRSLRREVKYGENSRIDLLLETGSCHHYVEVKNCHLVYPDGGAYFPDSVSERAAGHLRELTGCVQRGDKATVLFTVQRRDGLVVRPSDLHDPAFAEEARRAGDAGVRFTAVMLEPTREGFRFGGILPVDLKVYDPQPLSEYREALLPYSGWKRRSKPRSGGR